jgi:hypothetical protein
MSARVALERIAEIDKALDELRTAQKRLDDERKHLERLACEEIASFDETARLEAGGKTWWVEDAHYVSCTKDQRDAVMEAAREVGIADEITTIATTTLKSWLVTRMKDAGTEAGATLTAGTPFDGLLSVYSEPKLRHRTCT